MIFDYSSRLRAKPGFGWLFAIGAFAVALVIRILVADFLPAGFPFLTFFPAVMLASFLGGTKPGILCATLSTIAAWYLFIPPVWSFMLDPQGYVALGFFVMVLAVDILIIHVMNNSLDLARARRLEAEHLAEERRTLFQELQHRIANNLGFVSALLSMHKRRHADVPAITEALDDARLRLETLSRIHRRLYDPSSKDRPVGEHLAAICDDMVKASGHAAVTFTVRADPIILPVEKLMTVSLVLIEAVSNSLKHAFLVSGGGTIDVTLSQTGPDTIELRIADDGPGLPEGFDPEKTDRLGYRIMNSFAQSLRGNIAHDRVGGAVTRLTFPLS